MWETHEKSVTNQMTRKDWSNMWKAAKKSSSNQMTGKESWEIVE